MRYVLTGDFSEEYVLAEIEYLRGEHARGQLALWNCSEWQTSLYQRCKYCPL